MDGDTSVGWFERMSLCGVMGVCCSGGVNACCYWFWLGEADGFVAGFGNLGKFAGLYRINAGNQNIIVKHLSEGA
ncbi:MAG: hypothetical protein SWJ54_08250 [Cyanobacteriota bacterium]|nr:hypothetical protein [Cyanobacteriota bacterium]